MVKDIPSRICGNYGELIVSDAFLDVIKTTLEELGSFDKEIIIGAFEKFKNGGEFSDEERSEFISFVTNKDVEAHCMKQLSMLVTKRESNYKQAHFLRSIYFANKTNDTKKYILEKAGIEVSDTVFDIVGDVEEFSEQAKERIEAFKKWKQDNPRLAKGFKWKINIGNNGIEIKILNGLIHFGFKEPRNERFNEDTYSDDMFTAENITCLLNMLGGNRSDNKHQVGRAGKEAVSFFENVLGFKIGTSFWTSTLHPDNFGRVFALYIDEDYVDVDEGDTSDEKLIFPS